MEFIYKQRISTVPRLILKAHERNYKDRLWEMWIARYITMTSKTYIGFNEFYSKSITASAKITSKYDDKSKEDIMLNVNAIIQRTVNIGEEVM